VRAELQTLHANIEETGNAKRRWHSRSSLRVMLHDDHGHVGLGEAAPLPGMSPESARDARKAVAELEWPESPPLELDAIAEVVSRIDLGLPSARFAAESALISLAASIRGVPMWRTWTEEVEELAVAAALFGTKDTDVLQAAREAAAYEVIAVKAKVGWLPSQREIALLRDVRAIVGPIELRLDANGAFLKGELAERLDALAELEPAFLEEPCSLEDLRSLSEVPFPIAVDESLVGPDAEERLARALECEHIGVVVLKPTLLGGLERCRALAALARDAGREVIVSHTMEGVIARAAAAHLALALGGGATGLGDHPALSVLSDGLTAPWIDLAWIEPPSSPGLGLELAW
jgi:o-succinylbenzoate synthase